MPCCMYNARGCLNLVMMLSWQKSKVVGSNVSDSKAENEVYLGVQCICSLKHIFSCYTVKDKHEAEPLSHNREEQNLAPGANSSRRCGKCCCTVDTVVCNHLRNQPLGGARVKLSCRNQHVEKG